MFELTSVNTLLDNPQSAVHINDSFEVENFAVEGLEIFPQGPATYDIDLSHTGDGILAYGTVKLSVQVSCVRCLEDFQFTMESSVELLFYLKPTVDEEGDDLPSVNEQGEIALHEEMYAVLRVEAPFAPICDDECKGLCPQCGINLNDETCNCSNEPDQSHPFAGLKDLIKTDEE